MGNGDGLTLTGYAGAQVGYVKNPAGEAYANNGIVAGATLNCRLDDKKALSLNVEGTAGSAIGVKAEAGYTMDLGRNMGLELSAKAQVNADNKERDWADTEVHSFSAGLQVNDLQTGAQNDMSYSHQSKFDFQSNWESGEKRIGAGAKLTFKGKNFKMGLGLEGGIRTTMVKNNPLFNSTIVDNVYIHVEDQRLDEPINDHYECVQTYNKELEISSKKGYVTPTASFEYRPFANTKGIAKNIEIFGKGDLYQGQAGIRINTDVFGRKK